METKHTKGEWIIGNSEILRPASSVSISPYYKQICSFVNDGTDECKANAKLIAEAGTVASETGKTPRQLADENKELLKALIEANNRLKMYLTNEPNDGSDNGKILGLIINAINKATK